MPPSVTGQPWSWVTAITRPIFGAFRRPALPPRALWVLDMAHLANCQVYEDDGYRSWVRDERGHVHEVTREVDRLCAHGPRGACLVAGSWTAQGRYAVRRWEPTAFGTLTLVAAGRRRPLAIEAATQ